MRISDAVAIVLAVVFGATLLLNIYLPSEYARTLPRASIPGAGRTIPLNNHGQVVYLTASENRTLTVTFYAQFVLGIAAGLLFERNRRSR